MKDRKCQTDGCENDSKYPRLGMCHACYQYAQRWKSRSLPDIVRHKNKLRLFAHRLNEIEPRVRTLPVKTASRKKVKGRVLA